MIVVHRFVKTLALGAVVCVLPPYAGAQSALNRDAALTREDSAAIVSAAWQVVSKDQQRLRDVQLWIPQSKEDTTVFPLSPQLALVVQERGVPVAAQRSAGDDTVVFRVIDWREESAGQVLEFNSSWSTVLGTAQRPCRARSGNVERVRVANTGEVWRAALLFPVLHGDDVCEPFTEPNERDVQAAVLDSFFVRGATSLMVVDSTVIGSNHFVDEDYASALKALGSLPDGLREDFESRRPHRKKVEQLATRVPVVFFTASDRDALRGRNPNEYWQLFRERFPGSSTRVAVSRVGFSRDGQHALMLVDYGCGPRCGGTVYYLVVRDGATWRTIRTAQPRIS